MSFSTLDNAVVNTLWIDCICSDGKQPPDGYCVGVFGEVYHFSHTLYS